MLKTMNEFLTDPTVNLYPEDIDDATKEVISNWFGYRRVANNRFFPLWFYRTLERDYPRYIELLRIEARTADSEYDWLVTNYEERQVEIKGNDTIAQTDNGTSNQTNNRKFTAGTSRVTTHNDQDVTEGTLESKHTGTDNNLLTRNLNHQDTERVQIDAEGSNSSTRTPNLTDVSKTSNVDNSRHGVLQRQAPYDADYAGLTASTNANVAHGVGNDGVDTGTVEMLDNSSYMAGFPALVIQNPTAASDEVSSNSNVNYNENTHTGNEVNVTNTTNDEDNTTTRNGSDTGTERNERTANLTDKDTTNEEVTRTGRTETTNSGFDTDLTTIQGTNSKNVNKQATRNNLERTIFTGRSGQSPQLLLKDAVEFVKSTSAWKWLYQQIDKNFMMLYDIDEFEEV